MAEVNPDILAQLHRIHQAVNAGTLDRDSVNDALRLIHDFLTGKAYEEAPEAEVADDEADDEADDVHPTKRAPRKKR